MIHISFWNKKKFVSKTFKTKEKLTKFLIKHNVYMYDMDGMTHVSIGGLR